MRLRAIVVFALLCVAGCARPPDAQAIRAAIVAVGSAAKAQNSAQVLEHVSADFTGNGGEVDRTQLANLLRVRLLAKQGIGVRLGDIDVTLDGDRAIARFDATLSDAIGRWLEDRSATLHFETGWRRERGEWRCYNARWSRSGQ